MKPASRLTQREFHSVVRRWTLSTMPNFLGVGDGAISETSQPGVPFEMSVRQIVVANVYPYDLDQLHFSVSNLFEAPSEGTLQFCAAESEQQRFSLIYKLIRHADYTVNVKLPFWNEFIQPTLYEPQRLTVKCEWDGGRVNIGSIDFRYQPAPPLTKAQRLAIASNPKLLRTAYRCKTCADVISPYVFLERRRDFETSELGKHSIWYQNLPDRFVCRCGDLDMPLHFLRESMHRLLLEHVLNPRQLPAAKATGPLLPVGGMGDRFLSATKQVTDDPIAPDTAANATRKFEQLIASNPREEDVQTFIAKHPIMLAPFAAAYSIISKPQILNKFRADFGVVNSRRELILIELERPSMPLFRKNGTQSAELTDAFAQAERWHQEIAANRCGVVDCIPDCPRDITNVRYYVIAGRSQDDERKFVDRLVQRPGIQFMTYDHLIADVRNIHKHAT